MQTNTNPSTRANLLTQRTYCRPKPDGTFETWEDVVNRVIDHQRWLWIRARYGHSTLSEEQEAELQELKELMLSRKVSMSGRTLWLGGTDIAKTRESSMFNCLKKDTKFITSKGVKSFEDFKDGDTVEVWTHKGRWKPAIVKNYGEASLNKLEFVRGSSVAVVEATSNHRWYLKDGSVTASIKVGDYLQAPVSNFNSWTFEEAPFEEQLYWCYGFVYGDGSLSFCNGKATSRVRLCGDKNRYLERFEQVGFKSSSPLACKGDVFVYTGNYLKTLPNLEQDNPKLVQAFVAGYLAADGAKNNNFGRGKLDNAFKSIQSSSLESITFIRQVFPVVGQFITREEPISKVTNFGEHTETVRFGLSSGFGNSNVANFRLKSITESTVEEVWCLEVEEDASFTLANGVVTGNCSFAKVETVYDVVDVFWLLLQGCGVGFKPIRGTLNGFFKPIKNIQVIRSTKVLGERGRETNLEKIDKRNKVWTLSIGDSAEAWAKSIGKLLAGKHNVDTLILDFSEIRCAGERLKGYGWISSGDEAIAKAYLAIADILSKKAGCLLSCIDILDIINHLGTVLSSRRSAQICIMDVEDYEANQFITAKKDYWKSGNYQRGQSNNSLLFWKKPSREQLESIFDMMIASGGSEPAFINAEAATKRAPFFSGGNPCLTGDTLVPIKGKGLVAIGKLAGTLQTVRDGNGSFVTAPFEEVAKNQTIYEVTLSDGSKYKATKEHRWVLENGDTCSTLELELGIPLKLSNIEGMFGNIHKPKDAYRDAWNIADGTWYNSKKNSKIELYGNKQKVAPLFEAMGYPTRVNTKGTTTVSMLGVPYPDKTTIPSYVLEGDLETVCSFIKGYTESDGHIGHSNKGWLIQYVSIHRSFLEQFQQLLRLLGIFSKISNGQEAGYRKLPDQKGGSKDYLCKETFRLTISNPAKYFEYLEPSLVKKKAYKVTRRVTVESVVKLDTVETVYCCGVPTTNSFDLGTVHSGNCFEILLANKSFCNLSEIDLGKFIGDTEGLLRAIYLVGRANYRQTCVNLKDGILQEAWHLNNEFLRLCGVGLTGIARRPDLIAYDYRTFERAATNACYSMADELGLQRPKNCTTVKPSGTLSKIMDTTEGLHKPLGKYIFNNVVFSKHDENLPLLVEAGYKVMEHPIDQTSCIVTFPVCWDTVEFDVVNGVEVNLESAVTQLNRYKLLQDNYSQQNSSVTISYDVSEKESIIDWFMQNWDSYVGVSFLFRNDPTKTAKDLGYAYLPQEVVTKEVYEEYVATLMVVELGQNQDLSIDAGEECSSGACPIK
jgi:ribonucleotide reductase alpha subunit